MSTDIECDEKTNILPPMNPEYISRTLIEDLSNEVFYEIFEYFDCSDIFHGFFNLNNRLQNLINCPSLPLTIHRDFPSLSKVQHHYYTQFINLNKYRIVHLHICDRSFSRNWFPLSIMDLSFNRLESLILGRVRSEQLIPLFPTLISLPRLFTITIHLADNLQCLPEIYPLIFLLPALRKSEVLGKGSSDNISLPIYTNKPCSRIKRLIINHSCTITQLIAMLSYTSELRHLTCKELSKSYIQITGKLSVKMSHLTHITFNACEVDFDGFEIFIKEICSQLRVLCFNTSKDVTYLDATRWERLISQYMPYLYKFEFQYSECHYQMLELSSYHAQIDLFTSSFWINRGWFFQIKTGVDYWQPTEIIYSIQSYSKTWHEIYQHEEKSKYSNQTLEQSTISTDQEKIGTVKLIINHLDFPAFQQSLFDDMFSFICQRKITRLDIDCMKLSFCKFINLLYILPNLNSLRILSLFKLKCVTYENSELVNLWSKSNKIMNLELECFVNDIEIEKIQFFIDHCSQMEYFQMKCGGDFNIELILRHILTQDTNTIPKLCLLCLWIPITDDEMIKQVQRMIDFEKLIHNYKIQRTSDRIYIMKDR